jgi:hypothetical protein
VNLTLVVTLATAVVVTVVFALAVSLGTCVPVLLWLWLWLLCVQRNMGRVDTLLGALTERLQATTGILHTVVHPDDINVLLLRAVENAKAEVRQSPQ